MYDLARFIGRSLVRSWYERESVGEPVLAEGPLLLVGNHRNGLVDPVWIWLDSPRRVRFLAKFKLFSMPVLGWLIRRTEAIPVYRKKDNVDTALNQGAFEAVFARLAAGEAVVMFPEGESGDATHLRPLKTGAARMALGAEASAGWGGTVRLQAFGLYHEERDRWRSKVWVRVGTPFAVDDLRERFERDPWGAVEALNERVRAALEAVLVPVPEPGDEPLVACLEGCLPADPAPTGRRHLARLTACARALGEDRAGGRRLEPDLAALDGLLRGTGVRARDLDASPFAPDAAGIGVAAVLADALLLAPLQLAVQLTWLVPNGLARAVARWSPAPTDKRVTFTLLGTAALGLPWGVGVLTWAGLRAGPTGFLGALAVLLATALGAPSLWRARRRLGERGLAWLRLGGDPDRRREACERRSRLRARLADVGVGDPAADGSVRADAAPHEGPADGSHTGTVA